MYHFWHDRKKCCVLSRLPAPLRHRERSAHLQTSAKRKAAEKCSVLANDSSSNDCSRNENFLSPDLPLARSSLLITFPLLILVVLLRLRSPSRSRPIFSSSPSSSSSSSPEVELAMEVPPSPSSCPIPHPFHDDAYFHEIVPTYTNFGATWWHGR